MTSKPGRSYSMRSPRVGGPLSQSLAMIPPTMHGHEFNQPLSRVVMVRKTDQRTFSKGRRGGEPLLETVTRETVELFNGGRAERKYTSETRDIVTPKSNSMPSLSVNGTKKKVVGFVDQLSPERYSPMVCRLVAMPNADSNEAEQRVNESTRRFDGAREEKDERKREGESTVCTFQGFVRFGEWP